MTDMQKDAFVVVIYHNPQCGTSRNTLGLIRNAGVEPHVIEYRKCPPPRETLAAMLKRAGLSVRDILRKKGTPYEELGLDNSALTDAQIFDAIEKNPILIERPLVVTAERRPAVSAFGARSRHPAAAAGRIFQRGRRTGRR